ncbi:autophagy-related protein 27 [Dipodascopsis uninucleata]
MLLLTFMKSSTLAAVILSAQIVSAVFDCSAVIDGVTLNLTELAGPHSVQTSRSTPPTITTTKWTVNICNALSVNKSIPANMQCVAGTQVCGIQSIQLEGEAPVTSQVIPVSGDINGRAAKFELHDIKTATVASFLLSLDGGSWAESNDLKTDIEFVCDQAITDYTAKPEKLVSDGTDTNGLEFVSWDEQTLKLKWATAVVCEQNVVGAQQEQPQENQQQDNNNGEGGSAAWSIIRFILIAVLFLLLAYFGYTIYMNYQKGATGVDLLPSSQVVFDIPYVAKDLATKVSSGFSSNRDGYAVF